MWKKMIGWMVVGSSLLIGNVAMASPADRSPRESNRSTPAAHQAAEVETSHHFSPALHPAAPLALHRVEHVKPSRRIAPHLKVRVPLLQPPHPHG